MIQNDCKANWEIVKISLESVKSWLAQETEIADNEKRNLVERVLAAQTRVSTMEPDLFDIEEIMEEHGDILFNCLEFYGQHINTTLNLTSKMYRTICEAKFGMSPEELIQQTQIAQQQEQQEEESV